MKHHNRESQPQKDRVVVDLTAQRRRREERQTDGRRPRKVYDLPLIGPNRISVDYFKAA